MVSPERDEGETHVPTFTASLVGRVIAGKYRVERVIGKGGIGVVVAATHLQLEELVALKFLLPDAASSNSIVVRFLREARALVKIRSDHVARVLDVGEHETLGPYMVMEHLAGRDLSAVRRERGRLPLSDVVLYVAQACQAMAEAHALGIIHRDVKPANLFLTRSSDGADCVKVLDFGISKAAGSMAPGAEVGTSTETTNLIGSPNYMSPEQMMSARTVDVRADIWSLGVILYELLTAERPFTAATLPQVCMRVMHDTPVKPREHVPDIPPEIEAAILRCLEKDRDLRYANVAELAAAIAPFGPPQARACAERAARVLKVSSEASLAGTDASADAPPPSKSGSVVGVTNSLVPLSAPRKKPRTRVGLLAAAIALLAGGAWYGRARLAPQPDASATAEIATAAPTRAAEESASPAPAPAPLEHDGEETAPAPATTSPAVSSPRASPRPVRPQVARPKRAASTEPPAAATRPGAAVLPEDRK